MLLHITNIANFWWKKCWCQQKSRGVSRDVYIFLIFFRLGIAVLSFSIVTHLGQILSRGAFLPTIRQPPEKAKLFHKVNFWYSWSLKILAIEWFPFNFSINLKDCHFVVGRLKKLNLLPNFSFNSSFQKIVLLSLLLSLYVCY